MKKRLIEHINDVLDHNEKSAIIEHLDEKSCKRMDFTNVKIIDREPNNKNRLLSEMMSISYNKNSMNRMEVIKKFRKHFGSS